jgi:hypothetical protein
MGCYNICLCDTLVYLQDTTGVMDQREIFSIKRKALRINLEASIYGTFAEIGAGQEVARNFFQVGGSSGTVAKTMSAYDMAFSDAIYGEEGSGRYVSESRLNNMLDHEFALLQERLVGDKYQHRRFFSFADTCSAINYHKNNEPHCWIGLRFQLVPGGHVNQVTLHIRLKELDPVLEQQTIGSLGVNLIFACYWFSSDMDLFVSSLMDNVSSDQAEIDMISLTGPDFKDIDNRLLAVMLVKKGFTDATVFGSDKMVYQPKDVLYKKSILCLRGRFRPVTKVTEDMFRSGIANYSRLFDCEPSNILPLAEINISHLNTDDDFGEKDFLDRTDILCNLGYTVMVSNCHKHDTLLEYLRRCKPKQIGIIAGVMNLIDLFDESRYSYPQGEILSYFGEVFKSNTKMLVYPYQPRADSEIITLRNFPITGQLKVLFDFLCLSGFIEDITGYTPEYLQIFSQHTMQMIRAAEDGWESDVPDTVAEYIKANCLFDYPCDLLEHRRQQALLQSTSSHE